MSDQARDVPDRLARARAEFFEALRARDSGDAFTADPGAVWLDPSASRLTTKCPRCGQYGAHFVAPGFGMPGFYSCTERLLDDRIVSKDSPEWLARCNPKQETKSRSAQKEKRMTVAIKLTVLVVFLTGFALVFMNAAGAAGWHISYATALLLALSLRLAGALMEPWGSRAFVEPSEDSE